jgi:lipid-A-disaccharide synthase-like uncharacterized protein
MVAALFRDTPIPWLVIGLAGQVAFTGRFVVQWLVSEKKRESVIPRVFWLLSLAGSTLLFLYAFLQGDPPLVILQAINFGIYVRNIMLLRSGQTRGIALKSILPLILVAGLILAAVVKNKLDWSIAVPWLLCGFVGQTLWNCRFIVQWVVSERRGRSVMPTAFWWISLAGDAFLLAFSIYQRDPVYILAFSLNPIIYTRNLVLIARKRRQDPPPAPAA